MPFASCQLMYIRTKSERLYAALKSGVEDEDDERGRRGKEGRAERTRRRKEGRRKGREKERLVRSGVKSRLLARPLTPAPIVQTPEWPTRPARVCGGGGGDCDRERTSKQPTLTQARARSRRPARCTTGRSARGGGGRHEKA